MTEEVSIVFPHQLLEDNPCVDKHRRVFIVEDDLFFSYQPFHKLKLIMHRASMKFYADYLANKGFRVTYVDHDEYKNIAHFFNRCFSGEEVKKIHFVDPVDTWLTQRIAEAAKENQLEMQRYDSPVFLNTIEQNDLHLGKEKTNYRMGDFYKKQRAFYDVLMDGDKPKGGSWSFDADNRKALPKGYLAPFPNFPAKNQYVQRATEYVLANFNHHPGDVTHFIFPITFDDARELLDNFLNFRFFDFGPYQDALSSEQPFLNHSLISCALNNGLLSPMEVVDKAIAFANENKVPISSLEGFIRQIIGWREFVRALYERHGTTMRTTNFWKHSRKINIEKFKDIPPLYEVHQKSEKYAYTHHIERLMVLGNYFLLAETHPDEVYNYFMTYYIDAYDWVMVPNVYGMSQFADGGMLATKPYVSSSRYLIKMGASKTGNWTSVWDALYWRFLYKHESFFKSNHRTLPMTFHLNRMKKETMQNHLSIGNNHLLE